MLNKTTLKTSIENAMKANISSPTTAQNNEIAAFATALSNAIDAFVRGLEISYIGGLANSGGAVAGTFEYSLN